MSKAGSLSVFSRRMPGFIESETLPCLVFSNLNVTLNFGGIVGYLEGSTLTVKSLAGKAMLTSTTQNIFYTLLKHILVIVRSLDLR